MAYLEQQPASIELHEQTLICSGHWTLRNVRQLNRFLDQLDVNSVQVHSIDANGVTGFDSAGALVLERILTKALQGGADVCIEGLKERYKKIVGLIAQQKAIINQLQKPVVFPNWFAQVGKWWTEKLEQVLLFFAFMGEFASVVVSTLKSPHMLSLKSTVAAVYDAGARALPIVALLSFLIGIVLSYQAALQLKIYGFNIYIVKISGVSILREFGPLVTAIIMAGRTSTAFASFVGTMKVNQEIDALKTMGKNIISTLILPRGLALLITLPLLVIWADVFSIVGSMIMSKRILEINYYTYIETFRASVGVKQYVLGMVKVPFFALIISIVGCFQGLSVEMNAESVGRQTTKAAVQAIFLIIVADAFFSILFSALRL